jgi:hypothetical protein
MRIINELYIYSNLRPMYANTSINESLFDEELRFLKSYSTLELSRKINIFASILFILIGLVGNFFTIFIFSQKRFRTNSNNIFLLCLSINDSFFLIIHLFEDTFRTYTEMYIHEEKATDFKGKFLLDTIVNFVNITDKSNVTCSLINYLRYVLRFISAYILVIFTMVRLSVVEAPLKNHHSKKLAWTAVLVILLIALFINIWVLAAFEIQQESHFEFCEVKKNWKFEYFLSTNIYIVVILIIPMIIIIICNILIIYKTKKAEQKRKTNLTTQVTTYNQTIKSSRIITKFSPKKNTTQNNIETISLKRTCSRKQALAQTKVNFRFKPIYMNAAQKTNQNLNSLNNSSKITTILIFISFSYVLCNLPYLITWSCFFYEFVNNESIENEINKNYLFSVVQIAEVFYVLNYCLHFYVYCLTGTKFWNQLKFTSMKNF